MTKPDATVFSMPLPELEKRVQKALALAEEIRGLLPGMETMTQEERAHSQGRFRDKETAALTSVLDVVRHVPALFQSLADEDEGHDPGKFETDLIADRLHRRELFQKLADAVEPVSRAAGDVTLHMGALTKPVLLSAYRIAKALSVSDKAVRDKLSAALNFYGQIGKASAATRAAKKKPG